MPRSLRLELVPGRSLGPFELGASLWSTIDYLRAKKDSFPKIDIRFDPENPILAPVYIHVPPFLTLVFSGPAQLLVLISLSHLAPSPSFQLSEGAEPATTLTLTHGNSPLYSSVEAYQQAAARAGKKTGGEEGVHLEGALCREVVHRRFGPTYAGKTIDLEDGQREFVLGYPGVAFAFSLDGGSTQEDKHLLVSRMLLFVGEDWKVPHLDGAFLEETVTSRLAHSKADGPAGGRSAGGQSVRGRLEKAVVIPHDSVVLDFASSSTHESPDRIAIHLGHTTSEDLLCELGPPLRIHFKEDNRLEIHGAVADEEEGRKTATSDYFYNYFDLGIDFCMSGATHKVVKVVLHTNVPGSALFQRYARCPWEIRSSSAAKASAAKASAAGLATSPDETSSSSPLPPPAGRSKAEKSRRRGGGGTGGSQGQDPQAVAKFTDKLLDIIPKLSTQLSAESARASTMELDRGADMMGLTLAVDTKLVGLDGLVLEVDKRGWVVGVCAV